MDLRYELKYHDIAGCPWCVQFYVPVYNGIVGTLLGSNNPVVIEYQNTGDNFNDPYRPTQARIELAVEYNWKFVHLFEPDIMHCWVQIFQGEDETGALFFQGWVDPSQYEEPYDVAPYYLVITVVDGLKYLQDIKFAVEQNPDGTYTYYEDRAVECVILWDIFKKVGITEFEEYLNIFEVNMTQSTAHSPIMQLLLERDRFYELSCADALIEILAKYNAVIRHNNGVLQIFRPIDLWKPTLYGRRWLTKHEYITTQFDTIQYIQRQGTHSTSPFRQIPSGDQMMVLPARRISINLEYGSRDSWVNNYALHKDSYDPALRMFRHWRQLSQEPFTNNTEYPIPISDIVAREEEGACMRFGVGMYQRFGRFTFEVDQSNKEEMFKIEFDYGFYNAGIEPKRDPFISFFLRQQTIDVPFFQNRWYLKYDNIEDVSLEWHYVSWQRDAVSFINTRPAKDDDIGHGWTGWRTASLYFYGMPLSKDLEIGFGNYFSSSVYVAVRNVRFSVTSAELQRKTQKRGFFERVSEKLFMTDPNIVVTLPLFLVSSGGTLAARRILRPKYYLKDEWVEVAHIVESEYLPKVASKHGDELAFDFSLGDIVRVSDPMNKGDTHIINNLEQFAGSLAVVAVPSLYEQLQAFVEVHRITWYNADVIISVDASDVSSPRLLFAPTEVDGDLSIAASVSNNTGNVTGTATTISSQSGGARQIVRLAITGSSGWIDITINGKTRRMEYVPASTIRSTINHFVRLFGLEFAPVELRTSYDGTELIITGDAMGNAFTYTTNSGGLIAMQTSYTAPSVLSQRVDAVTISGSNGSIDISCEGITRTLTITDLPPTLQEMIFEDWSPSTLAVPSSKWRYEGAAHDHYPQKRLLELVGDEIASQYARSKYLLQVPIYENVKGQISILNINGCFIDDIHKSGHTPRRFAINRGTFNVRHRRWELDLVELLPYFGPNAPVEYLPPDYDLGDPPIDEEDSAYVPPPSASATPPEPEVLIALNDFVTAVPEGRTGTSFDFTFHYDCSVPVTADISYYFSSDNQGANMVGTIKTVSVDFKQGINIYKTIIGAVYPTSGTRYLNVVLKDKPTEHIISNSFTVVSIGFDNIEELYSPQDPGASITVSVSTYTSGGSMTLPVYWVIRDSVGYVVSQGSHTVSFTVGASIKSIPFIMIPSGTFYGCTLGMGFTPVANQITSNPFDVAFI